MGHHSAAGCAFGPYLVAHTKTAEGLLNTVSVTLLLRLLTIMASQMKCCLLLPASKCRVRCCFPVRCPSVSQHACFQGLAPLVDVHEVEQCIVDLGGTVNYKHFYEPDMKKCDSDDTESELPDQQCSAKASKACMALFPGLDWCFHPCQHPGLQSCLVGRL